MIFQAGGMQGKRGGCVLFSGSVHDISGRVYAWGGCVLEGGAGGDRGPRLAGTQRKEREKSRFRKKIILFIIIFCLTG